MLGCRVRSVEIYPEGGGVTKKASNLRRGDLEWNFDPGVELRAYREILIALAGPYAQRRYAPRSDWRQKRYSHSFGGETDFSIVKDGVNRLYNDDPKVTPSYLRFVQARTEQLVEQHWREIECVATYLLQHGSFKGDPRELWHALLPPIFSKHSERVKAEATQSR